jgi:hypothetical protein
MFERGIPTSQVRAVIESGEIIARYPEDKPLPSLLILGFMDKVPLHVVVGEGIAEPTCVVITVSVPEASVWHTDFKTRKSV